MAQLIAILPDKSVVEFDKGKFDNWCVYLTRNEKPKYAPKDSEYFGIIKDLGIKYGNQKVYNSFVNYYELTSYKIDKSIIELIIDISLEYGEDKNEICTWFTVIYAGMIAEENKDHAILKKRIKRLGLHQVLIDNLKPEYAANFSRGKNWKEIDKICREKGF